MFLYTIRFLILIPTVFADISVITAFQSQLQIKDFHLTRCQNVVNEPISLEDIAIEIGDGKNLFLSGTFSTTVDLDSPITAKNELKKKVVVWVHVPCAENLGSCTYEDLCEFGIPKNTTCPTIFKTNEVPCRCPIKKGTYIIPKMLSFTPGTSIYDGRYKGTIMISSKELQLACYNYSFELYEQYY